MLKMDILKYEGAQLQRYDFTIKRVLPLGLIMGTYSWDFEAGVS